MFSPNVEKLQEPIFLQPGHSLVVYFKPFTKPKEWMEIAKLTRKVILLSKAVRWKATGDLHVAFNHDTHDGPPTKYWSDDNGEFALNDKMQCVSFYASPQNRAVTLYLEVM